MDTDDDIDYDDDVDGYDGDDDDDVTYSDDTDGVAVMMSGRPWSWVKLYLWSCEIILHFIIYS